MFFGAYGRARGGVKGSSAPGTRPRRDDAGLAAARQIRLVVGNHYSRLL
jgi:hypothetical protein